MNLQDKLIVNAAMRRKGILPELEAFDLGMIDYAKRTGAGTTAKASSVQDG